MKILTLLLLGVCCVFIAPEGRASAFEADAEVTQSKVVMMFDSDTKKMERTRYFKLEAELFQAEFWFGDAVPHSRSQRSRQQSASEPDDFSLIKMRLMLWGSGEKFEKMGKSILEDTWQSERTAVFTDWQTYQEKLLAQGVLLRDRSEWNRERAEKFIKVDYWRPSPKHREISKFLFPELNRLSKLPGRQFIPITTQKHHRYYSWHYIIVGELTSINYVFH